MQLIIDLDAGTNEEVSQCICGVCKHVSWFKNNATPKGWVVTRDDYSDLVCPDCNPYLRHSQAPDFHKMKRIEDANIPYIQIERFTQ